MTFKDNVKRSVNDFVVPLGDDGLGDVFGAVVLLLHQLPDLLRGEDKGQRSAAAHSHPHCVSDIHKIEVHQNNISEIHPLDTFCRTLRVVVSFHLCIWSHVCVHGR